jgi:uncharacterized protein (TIGR03546 family)
MFFKPLRKLIGVFRGSLSPTMILLTVILGVWFGLTPGWSGLHTAILFVVLILNIGIGFFLICAAIGKALCFALAPVLYYVGIWVQDSLSGLLNFLASIPIIGLTDFARYSIAGALIVGPGLGLVFGVPIVRLVIRFRHAWISFEDKSEKMRKFQSKRWVRVLDRILIGKSVKDIRGVITSRPKIIRKVGVIFVLLIAVLSAVGLSFLKDEKVRDYAAGAMTKINGAEVNLEKVELSLKSGHISVTGMQWTDPDQPENNKFAVGKLSTDASMYHLSIGRIILDEVEVSNVEFDQKRAQPGEVLEKPKKEEKPFEWKVDKEDIEKLESYYKKAKKVKEWLQKIGEWMPEKEEEPEKQIPERYLEYLNARAPVSPTPRILIRKVVMDGVEIPLEQVGKSKVTLMNISDAPNAAGLPLTIEIQSNVNSSMLKFVGHFENPDLGGVITGKLVNVDLAQLQKDMSETNRVKFTGGTADVALDGAIGRRMIDLGLGVKVNDFQAGFDGQEGLFGLDPEISKQAIEVLKNIDTRLRLVGPLKEPRLALDSTGLSGQFKNALVDAGKARLAQELDKQLGKHLGDKLPEPAKDIIDKTLKDGLGGIGDLLGGKKKKEEK